MKKMLSVALAAGALSLSLTALAAPAQAAPFGTTPITPSKAACEKDSFNDRVRCGAAHTETFLRSRGAQGVVRETVYAPEGPSGLAWPSAPGIGSPFCGYLDARPLYPMAFGAHHCDRTTFILPSTDTPLFQNEVWATTVLIHESGHGMQEAKGVDTVTKTLTGDAKAQKPMELSSDCWSGVGIKYLIGKGELPATAYAEAGRLWSSIGHKGDVLHGNGPERRAAYEKGYAGGAAACNVIAGKKIFR